MHKHPILLIDGHPIWRQGIVSLIGGEPDLEVCGQTNSLTDGLDLVSFLKPELVVLDIAHDEGRGIQLIKSVVNEHPTVSILVLSLIDERLYAERVIRAGAKGYLMKQESGDVLIMAIRQVLRGGVYLSAGMRDFLLNKALGVEGDHHQPDLGWLSDREMQVFTLLGNGKGNREIARQMNVSIKTIDAYRAHIKQKLKLRNGMELIRLAVLHVQPYATAVKTAGPRPGTPARSLSEPSIIKHEAEVR
jgi:DNA-binding NarL/FixJ family response regulator